MHLQSSYSMKPQRIPFIQTGAKTEKKVETEFGITLKMLLTILGIKKPLPKQ